MNDRFDSPMARFFERRNRHSSLPARANTSTVRMDRTDDGYRVVADMPGFEREEIDLRYRDGTLHLSAHHESGDGSSYESRQVVERLSVPEHVDHEAISASYHNGVLEVLLPAETDDEDYRIHVE